MDRGNENATKYLDGFGVHWYWDKIAPPSLLDRTHKDYPNKFILNTESCIGKCVYILFNIYLIHL